MKNYEDLKMKSIANRKFMTLDEFIQKTVEEGEERFVKFFNGAQAINTRLHQFELLPGFGKKHTQAILDAREEKPFESLEDVKERVANMPDPAKTVTKRIIEEIMSMQRNNLFT